MKFKRLFIVALVLFAIGFASIGVTQAVVSMYKQVTGLGNVDYSEEVTFSDLRVASPTKVQVVLTSNSNTVASYVYIVTLYLDGVAVAPLGNVSWSAGQIPGTSKTVNFTGLSLGSVVNIGAEVTK